MEVSFKAGLTLWYLILVKSKGFSIHGTFDGVIELFLRSGFVVESFRRTRRHPFRVGRSPLSDQLGSIFI